MAAVPSPMIDSRPIQPVILVDQQGNIITVISTSQTVQGISAAGSSTAAINPVLVGGNDPTNLLQDLQVDSSKNLLVSLNTSIDAFNDAIAAHASAYFPAVFSASPLASPYTLTMGNILGATTNSPSVRDPQMGQARVQNNTNQNITAATLQFNASASPGLGTSEVITYPYPATIAITSGGGSRDLFFPITKGVLDNVSLILTFASAPASGTVAVQLVWSAQPGSKSSDYRATGTTALTNTASTVVITAPSSPLGMEIFLVSAINESASVSTEVDLLDGSTNLNLRGYALSGGFGYVWTFPQPLRISAGSALNAQAVTTNANVRMAAFGRFVV